MFIVGKVKGAQHGLKGQCVMIPADLSKIQKVLPRTFSNDCLISLALKRCLSEKSSVNKQYIRPAMLNNALSKLVEVNPFYSNVVKVSNWKEVSQEFDPELWNNLTKNEKDDSNEDDSFTDLQVVTRKKVARMITKRINFLQSLIQQPCITKMDQIYPRMKLLILLQVKGKYQFHFIPNQIGKYFVSVLIGLKRMQ